MIRRLCVLALALYPRAWRVRYGAEMRALLDARGPSLPALFDVLMGALDAHLRPAGLTVPPPERMRGTLWVTVTCFGSLALLGAGFAKATEDVPFRAAGQAHPLLGDARAAVAALAGACVVVIVLAGGPIAYGVLRQAWRDRTPALVRAIGYGRDHCCCPARRRRRAGRGRWWPARAVACGPGAVGRLRPAPGARRHRLCARRP